MNVDDYMEALRALNAGDSAGFKQQIDDILQSKAHDAIEVTRVEVADQMFGNDREEDLDQTGEDYSENEDRMEELDSDVKARMDSRAGSKAKQDQQNEIGRKNNAKQNRIMIKHGDKESQRRARAAANPNAKG